MRPDGKEILAYLQGQEPEMLAVIQAMAGIESPSSNPDAQRPMREFLVGLMEELDFACSRVTGRKSGGHLYSRPRTRQRGKPRQLMLGHYDTVWPEGTLAAMPVERQGDVVHGPGVYDMKGGIAQMVFALRAIRHFDLQPPLTPVVFLNSDEEIGSRESTRHIRRLAKVSDRVFVLEPSLGQEGLLKTARKGVGRFTVKVHGRAAHAGLDPDAGASAILELSHVIQSLFGLNDPERGVTVNVGTIDGGLRPNVIAPKSRAVVDVRVRTERDAAWVSEAIHALRPITPGVRLEIEGGIGRPALEPTPRNQVLWTLAKDLATELDLELRQGIAGGGSDGNTTSQYTATLDGLGPVGDGAHAAHEHLKLSHTLERTALLAMLLLAPGQNARNAP
jgi:glutamate carboxypeptidase